MGATAAVLLSDDVKVQTVRAANPGPPGAVVAWTTTNSDWGAKWRASTVNPSEYVLTGKTSTGSDAGGALVGNEEYWRWFRDEVVSRWGVDTAAASATLTWQYLSGGTGTRINGVGKFRDAVDGTPRSVATITNSSGTEVGGKIVMTEAAAAWVRAKIDTQFPPVVEPPPPPPPPTGDFTDPLNQAIPAAWTWEGDITHFRSTHPTTNWWADQGNGGLEVDAEGNGLVDESSRGNFRIFTLRGGPANDGIFPADQRLDVDFRSLGWQATATTSFDGIKLWLRRQDPLFPDDPILTGYTIEPTQRSNKLYIQRKLNGDTRAQYPSYNAYVCVSGACGTYYLIAQANLAAIPVDTWSRLGGSAYTNTQGTTSTADDTVTLRVMRDGVTVLQFTDGFTAAKGPPILTGGRVGIRSDNLNHNLKNAVVTGSTP